MSETCALGSNASLSASGNQDIAHPDKALKEVEMSLREHPTFDSLPRAEEPTNTRRTLTSERP